MDKFVIMKNWIDYVKDSCSEEELKEYIYGIVKYGLYEEEYKSSNSLVNVSLKFVLPQIDKMQEKYSERVAYGKTKGRKKLTDDVRIWELAQEGKNGQQIAEELGINAKTIYGSEGWKNRNNKDYLGDKNDEGEFSF